jgi:hypothetical protein
VNALAQIQAQAALLQKLTDTFSHQRPCTCALHMRRTRRHSSKNKWGIASTHMMMQVHGNAGLPATTCTSSEPRGHKTAFFDHAMPTTAAS